MDFNHLSLYRAMMGMSIFAERLYGSLQAADGVENCGFMTANGTFPRVCFYEVFAQHYAQVPEDGKEILPLFLQLWSQSFVSQIFALLFHRWVRRFKLDCET